MEVNGTEARAEEAAVTLALSVAVTVISAIGLLLNAYILFIIVITKQPASASSVLLVHLGAVGALASGAALCGGGGACVCSALLHALHPLQLWTVCGLHADRAAAIAAPLHYAAIVSAKKVLICVASGWVATAALLAPLAAAQPPLAYSAGLGNCAPDCGAGPAALGFCIVYASVTLILPAALVLLCSLKILRIARYHRHRIAAAIYEVTLSAQVTVTHQRNPFSPPPPPRRRALSAVLQPLGSLAILYFPYYCVLIWPAVAVPPQPLAALSAALLAAAPPVNGILYGIRSRALRDSLRNYRRKRMTKSEVTQEIQARTPSACGSRRPSLSAGSGCIRPPTTRRLSDAAAMGSRGSERPAQRAASCNMLQDSQEEEVVPRPRTSAIPIIRAPPHVVLGRALGLEEMGGTRDRRRRQSPRITVTRAMSDESESPTRRPLCRQQSRSSGALLGGVPYSPAISEHVHLDSHADEQLLLTWPQNGTHEKHDAL
ncbi:beta-3 adrenergic receptor isoform X2 [Spodoptera frugiperda]|uniref:Beta-3 adrenergic receptor isoform X2 n=1 Tax=Spodoptera frugiperda TaxID=7108 RepID=A0A9R0D4T9_SPOFR|nr:beta-3 adrenergic receptor isoform X2 [Spodoptera frugiperda]